MPLSSYTLIHSETKLTPEQMKILVTWAKIKFDKVMVPTE